MLVVPLGVLGALLAATLRGLANDVYFQVGLLTTIGLAAKNAILIIEFAHRPDGARRGAGADATLEAARLRLRPILMTSLAFMLRRAAAGARDRRRARAARTRSAPACSAACSRPPCLAIFFVPLFFVLVRRRFQGRAAVHAETAPGAVAAQPAAEGH